MAKDKADELLVACAGVLDAPEVTGTIPVRLLDDCAGIAVLRVSKKNIIGLGAAGILVARSAQGE